MRNKLLTGMLFFLVFCNPKADTRLQVIKELAPNKNYLSKTILLVIPFDGCSSCYNEAVDIIPRVNDNSGLVIITDRDKKRINSFIKEYGFENEKIIKDTLQKTVISGLVDVNPCIYVIEENKLKFSYEVEHSMLSAIDKYVFGEK